MARTAGKPHANAIRQMRKPHPRPANFLNMPFYGFGKKSQADLPATSRMTKKEARNDVAGRKG